MKKHLTEAEVTAALKRIVVVCDTREKENGHILGYFKQNGIEHITRTLKTGDYSVMLDGFTYEDEIAIEKKNGLDELAGNVTRDRQRFERELIRAKAHGIKIFLLIEGCQWSDIGKKRYRSQVEPRAFESTLLSWQARYNTTLFFYPKEDAGKLIHGLLWYWVRQSLQTC